MKIFILIFTVLMTTTIHAAHAWEWRQCHKENKCCSVEQCSNGLPAYQRCDKDVAVGATHICVTLLKGCFHGNNRGPYTLTIKLGDYVWDQIKIPGTSKVSKTVEFPKGATCLFPGYSEECVPDGPC